MKKQVIFLFIIILSSCHVPYHIQEKEILAKKDDDAKPLIISGSSRLYNGGFKSVYGCYPGCAVLHGGDKTEGVPKIIAGEGLKIVETPNSGNNIAVISTEIDNLPNSIGRLSGKSGMHSIAIGSKALEMFSCKERGHVKPDVVMTTAMYCESYTIETDSSTILVHPPCNYDRYTCIRCLEYVEEQQKERREIIYKK